MALIILLFSASPNKRTNFRLQLHCNAKRHLQVITIARRAYFLIGSTHAFVPWPRGTWVVNRVGVGFKQIGSLFAGSTIDGNRMICLTKYVTVRVSKGEPNLYDGFWLARVSAVCRSPFCGHVCTRTHMHTYTHTYGFYTSPRLCTHRRTDGFQTLHQLQNWNFSINNNYHCQRTDVTSRSLPDPEWFSSDLSQKQNGEA